MRFSIIVPFYGIQNVKRQNLFERCIESIKAQTFTDYELIISKDGKDLSESRNMGIQKTKGEWLIFVDADDWISNDLLETLNSTISEYPSTDIIEFPINVHEGAKDEKMLAFDKQRYPLSSKYYINLWLEEKEYTHTYACNKAYRRELFENVKYVEGRKFEDVWTLPLLLEKAQELVTTDEGCYHYMWNDDSICAKADGQDLTDLLEAHLEVTNRWNLQNESGFGEYFMHILNIQIDVFKKNGKILLSDFKFKLQTSDFKLKIKYIIYKIFGVKKMCKLWSTL